MMNNLEPLWILICASLFPVTAFYFVLFKQVTKILGERHIATYKALGEVGFVKNNTIVNSNKFIVYLLQRKYASLNDAELTKKANMCRFLLITGMILFLFAFILPIYIGHSV